MFSEELLQSFTEDPTVILIGVLVLLDFLLGVAYAVKAGVFRLSYVADFLRNDVLGKVVPYYAVWVAVHTGADFSLAGLDVIEESTGAVVVLALAGSILGSLRDLGLANAGATLAGDPPGQ